MKSHGRGVEGERGWCTEGKVESEEKGMEGVEGKGESQREREGRRVEREGWRMGESHGRGSEEWRERGSGGGKGRIRGRERGKERDGEGEKGLETKSIPSQKRERLTN